MCWDMFCVVGRLSIAEENAYGQDGDLPVHCLPFWLPGKSETESVATHAYLNKAYGLLRAQFGYITFWPYELGH